MSYILRMKICFNDFLSEKWKWIMYVTKAHLFHDLYIFFM